MKILFMGTPLFSVPSLESLHRSGQEIVAVLTAPDRPGGRGRRLIAPPVKDRARKLGLDIWQPQKLSGSDFFHRLRNLAPDLIVSAAFGRYIPAVLLESVPRGGINLHPSLLPRYRGAAPIAWALIRGDEISGVTVHYLSGEMDAGDILAQETVAIAPDDDLPALSRKLARKGAELLLGVVRQIEGDQTRPRPQDENEATAAPKLSKENGHLNWKQPASDIYNLVRGLNPWPGAYTFISGKKGVRMLKIIKAAVLEDAGGDPGEILEASGDRLVIAAGEGAIGILSLQLEGGRKMSAAEFLRGHRLRAGEMMNSARG